MNTKYIEDINVPDKHKKNNFWYSHSVNESRKEFGLISNLVSCLEQTKAAIIRAKMLMVGCKPFESNWKLDIASSNHILNFELSKLEILCSIREECPKKGTARYTSKPSFFMILAYFLAALNASSSLQRSAPTSLQQNTSPLCASADHLAACKDQRCCMWLSDSHNNGSEALRQ